MGTKASKDARKTHGAEKKGDIFYIDPEKLTLVTDPESDAYDRRVHDEPSEKFILNVMHYGVQTPIKVRRNTESGETEVLWGRGRTKALREANKRLIKRGEDPKLMPFVVVRSARGAELVGMIISENEQRRPDTAMNRAEKAARMIDRGASHEDAAIALGLETGQVKNLLALLGAPKFVRHAVEAEKVTEDASFIDDLGADSLDIVELVMAFEEEFGVEIPDDAAEKIATVSDAITYIDEHKG